jgi:hypothetical protein
MRAWWIGLALLAFTVCTAGAQQPRPSAEPWFRGGTWMFSLGAGGAAFTDFQRGTARRIPGDATAPELRDFRRRLSARTTATGGGSATYWAADTWGVRGSIAYAPSAFSVWNEGPAQRVLDERMGGDRAIYAALDVWLAAGAAVFRLPVSAGRVVPFGIAGAGLVSYAVRGAEALPPEARQRFAAGAWRAPAAVVGLGAVIPLERENLLLSFELTNHIAPTPLNDAGRGQTFELSGITLQLEPDRTRGGDGISITGNLRLALGLTLPVR